MSLTHSVWRRCRRVILCGAAAPVFLSLASADEPLPVLPTAPKPAVVVTAPTVVDLAAARRLALENQPSLAAYRASLAAAQAKVDALNNLPAVAGLTNSDLKYRRCQADLGVRIAEAQLNQGAWETLEAVGRLYWGAVFANEQLAVVQSALDDLRARIKSKEDANYHWTHDQFRVFVEYLEGQKASAVEGRNRSLAALREALGLCSDACLDVADRQLPATLQPVCKEEVIAAALARRGEIVMTNLAAEVAAIEIDAQHAIHGYSGRTFAAGADIHARPVPTGDRGRDYQPAAVGPEMPTLLAGSRHDRVEQAKAYAARAHAVAEKTRNLVILDTENALSQWREASVRWERFRKARDLAAANAEAREKQAKKDEGVTRSEAIRAAEIRTQMRAEANEAHYRMVQALAALERVTAGGFCPFGDQ